MLLFKNRMTNLSNVELGVGVISVTTDILAAKVNPISRINSNNIVVTLVSMRENSPF